MHHHRTGARRSAELTLYTRDGQRKYLNASERTRFLAAAATTEPTTRTFCLTLAYTGCRISEALALTATSVQPAHLASLPGPAGVISIQTLKQRVRGRVRELPIPPELLADIAAVHDLSQATHTRLWSWQRTWGWMRVKAVMDQAGISGLQASPKGLRHGFAVHAIHTGIPLQQVQRWLGHTQLRTTAIYATVLGPEEIALAARMWQ